MPGVYAHFAKSMRRMSRDPKSTSAEHRHLRERFAKAGRKCIEKPSVRL